MSLRAQKTGPVVSRWILYWGDYVVGFVQGHHRGQIYDVVLANAVEGFIASQERTLAAAIQWAEQELKRIENGTPTN